MQCLDVAKIHPARIQSQLSEPKEPAPNKIEKNAFISKVCYVSYATVG